ATPLRVVIPFRSSLGLVTVLPGSVPDPEDEAMLELMNLDIISVRLANWVCTFDTGFVCFGTGIACFDPGFGYSSRLHH
nr:hypothetical protein [Tanacetum cinerariifolium]